MAADVYSAQSNMGRGGWTWYTGASGWMYRVAAEWILGIEKRGNTLIINPCIPRYWKEFSFEYIYNNTKYNIVVKNPKSICKSDKSTTINLVDDKIKHDIEIIM